MRTIILFTFLALTSHTFAQSKRVDSTSYSREKGKYVKGWIEDSPIRVIKTYTSKGKRNYLVKEVYSLPDNKLKEVNAEVKNNALDGSYKEYIKDSLLIEGNYRNGEKIGIWKEQYQPSQFEITSSYNEEGRRIKKDVKLNDNLEVFDIKALDRKPYLYGQFFQKTNKWKYAVRLKDSQAKRNKKIEFKVLLLNTGEFGSIQLIKADPEFVDSDIIDIANSIFLNARLMPATIKDRVVNCTMDLTFIYLGIDKAELNINE